MKQILKDAFKSDELQQHLEDVIAVDEQVAAEDLADRLIIDEAKYVLRKFTGGEGFEQEEELLGEHGPEQQKWAKKNVAAIRRFLKKHAV